MGMETVVDAAVGDKNKKILSNVSSYIDSPGFDENLSAVLWHHKVFITIG